MKFWGEKIRKKVERFRDFVMKFKVPSAQFATNAHETKKSASLLIWAFEENPVWNRFKHVNV